MTASTLKLQHAALEQIEALRTESVRIDQHLQTMTARVIAGDLTWNTVGELERLTSHLREYSDLHDRLEGSTHG